MKTIIEDKGELTGAARLLEQLRLQLNGHDALDVIHALAAFVALKLRTTPEDVADRAIERFGEIIRDTLEAYRQNERADLILVPHVERRQTPGEQPQ